MVELGVGRLGDSKTLNGLPLTTRMCSCTPPPYSNLKVVLLLCIIVGSINPLYKLCIDHNLSEGQLAVDDGTAELDQVVLVEDSLPRSCVVVDFDRIFYPLYLSETPGRTRTAPQK